MRVLQVLALAAPLLLAGCGGSNGCDGKEMGTLVTDANLCRLTCHSTTRDQAITFLGPPDSSIGKTDLTYSYQCVSASAQNALMVSLVFDATTGVLTSVSRIGMGIYASGTLPSCLDACAEG